MVHYQLKFDTEFETSINADITAKGKLDFSLTKLLGENSSLQCGDLKYVEEFGSKDGTHSSMSFSGAKWQDNICLGGIQITLGSVNVLVGNGETSKIPVSVDIFMTMNQELEISVEAKLALSYHQLTKTGVNVDVENSDITKRLTSYQESYDPDLYETEGVKKPATLKITPSGTLKGSITKQMGVAIGLRIANIYPAVVEASGALGLNGEVSALASIDTNGETVAEVCTKLDFTPKVGIYTAVGLAFDGEVVIDETFFNHSSEVDFNAGFYYNYEYTFEKLAGLDTCGTYKEDVSYDIKHTLAGLSIENLNIKDTTKTAKKVSIIIYDKTGNIVAEAFNKDEASFNLSSGEYTLYVFIEMESGERYLDSQLIEVKPVPANLQVTTNNYDATLTWDKIDGVEEYTICFSEEEIINGVCPSEDYLITTNFNSYVLHTLNANIPYSVMVYYDVDLVRNLSTVEIFSINNTNVEFDLTLDSATSTHLNLSWIKPSLATTFKVCQSVDEIHYESAKTCESRLDGSFWDTTSTTSLSLSTDPNGNILDQNILYYFRVVAYNDSDAVVGVSSEISGKLNTNTPPVANAGADQSINEGESVTFYGSGSSDAEGAPLSYVWSQPAPAVPIDLGNNEEENLTLTNLSVGNYTFILTVSDGIDSHSDDVKVTVNALPTITLSDVTSITMGETVNFEATLSTALLTGYVVKISLGDGGGGYIAPETMTENLSRDRFTYSQVISRDGERVYRVALFNQIGLQVSDWLNGTYSVSEVPNNIPTAKITTDTTTLVEGEELILSASESVDPDGGGLSYKWVHISGGDLANAILGTSETLTLDAQNLKNIGAHTIGLTVTDQDGDINSTTINITLEGANSTSLLSDTATQWEEAVNSTYVEGNTYKHRYMLALYEDTSCSLVDLNMEIENQNEDKKTLYDNTNKIYTPDTALEETSSCTWSNSSDLLTLSFYGGSQVRSIPLVDGTLRVGDVMDSECDESNGCKLTKLSPIDTVDKNAISNHALEIFMADGTVATWNFREDNSVKIYNEGNTTIQFDGSWALSDSYISILDSGGSTVLRANNLTYRTVDLIDFTSIKGYISDIQVLAPVVGGTSAVKKTGQTKSYNEAGDEVIDGSIKDDGFYQTGVTPSYTRDDAKEVVTDHITGLEWQDDSEAGTVTKPWVTQANYDAGNYDDTSGDTAATYCANLTLDGGGWRVPSRVELRSIAEYGHYNPAINPAFVNVASNYYWSSTTGASYTYNAWYVDFNGGYQNDYDKNSYYYVRCVRAGQ